MHLTWATLRRERILHSPIAVKVNDFLRDYSRSKEIYLKISYVNPDHVHALIDVPRGIRVEFAVKLLKGASSHWINANEITRTRFAWGRGFGAFSVSQSNVDIVAHYIANQESHHRRKSFEDELRLLVSAYGLTWLSEGDE
jgi:REP element-mobilizing transposase RayT